MNKKLILIGLTLLLLFTGCSNDTEPKDTSDYDNCLENKSEIIRTDYKYCITEKIKADYSNVLETCRRGTRMLHCGYLKVF